MTESRAASPHLRVLHLSDMHLFGDDTWHYGRVDTAAALRRVLDAAAGVADIDLVALSCDLTDDGTPAAYRRLADLIEPWAAERGAAVAYAMGNHDDRAGFEEVLGARTGIVTVKGARVLHLDSSVPGAGYGLVDDAQLAWLRDELASSDTPAVVLLHHPPTPACTPLLQALELQNPTALLDTCSGTGVLAILAGHYHHSLVTAERGIPVIVAPGITNTTDLTAPAGHERALTGSGFAVIDIPLSAEEAPRVMVQRAPAPDDGQVIFDLDAATVAEIATKAGPPRN